MPTDLTVILDHRPGELARLAEITGEAGVTVHGLAAFTGEGRGVVHLLLDDGARGRLQGGARVRRDGDRRRAGGLRDRRRGPACSPRRADPAASRGYVNVDLAYTAFTGGKIVIATDDVASARAMLRYVAHRGERGFGAGRMLRASSITR
jgi:hypothetical protein